MYYNKEYYAAKRKREQRRNAGLGVGGVLLATGLVFGALQIDWPEQPVPCQLAVTEQARQAAAAGFEVEVQDQYGYECELTPGGTWVLDD